MVFLRWIEVQLAGELIIVRCPVACSQQSSGTDAFSITSNSAGARGYQVCGYVFLRYGIDLGWINNSLGRQRWVRLKKRIGLQECHHVGVGATSGAGMGEVAGQHLWSEG